MIEKLIDLPQWLDSMGKGPTAQRLIKGVSWSMVSGVITSAATLLASIFVARLLGPAQFGGFGIMQSTLAAFLIFTGPALGVTATKYIAELRESDPGRAMRILHLSNRVALLLGGIIALLLFITAPYLAEKALAAPKLIVPLKIVASALFLSSINSAQLGALAGFEAFRSIAKINVLRGIAAFPVMWWLTMRFGLTGAVVSLSVLAALGCLASSWFLRREIQRAKFPSANKRFWREAGLLMEFTLPAMLSSGLYFFPTWLANMILVRQTNGYAEMGIFNAASQWRAAILFLPSVVIAPFLSIMANLAGTGSMVRYRKVFLTSVVAVTLAALIPGGAVIFMAKQIMRAYGTGFSNGVLVVILIAVSTILAAPCMAIMQAIASIGNLWSSVMMIGAWGIIFLVSAFFFRHLGAEGLAIAYAIAYSLQLLFFAGYTYFVLKPTMTIASVELPEKLV